MANYHKALVSQLVNSKITEEEMNESTQSLSHRSMYFNEVFGINLLMRHSQYTRELKDPQNPMMGARDLGLTSHGKGHIEFTANHFSDYCPEIIQIITSDLPRAEQSGIIMKQKLSEKGIVVKMGVSSLLHESNAADIRNALVHSIELLGMSMKLVTIYITHEPNINTWAEEVLLEKNYYPEYAEMLTGKKGMVFQNGFLYVNGIKQ